jgi:4-hydroxy-3-methylbut-2-enyl diphosphate reductase
VEAIQFKIQNSKFKIPFEYHDTICRNVANRAAQLQDFARANDVVLFVGGTKSSNARVLYKHCVEANEKTYFVSTADEIENLKFKISNLINTNPDLKIGICGATSTPLWLMEAVAKRLAFSD